MAASASALPPLPSAWPTRGDEQRNATLKQLGETGETDARGVPITEALVDQILAAAQRDPDDHPTFRAARFERATFQGAAWFREATFQGAAEFDNATFEGAWFDGATFQRYAGFGWATFQEVVPALVEVEVAVPHLSPAVG